MSLDLSVLAQKGPVAGESALKARNPDYCTAVQVRLAMQTSDGSPHGDKAQDTDKYERLVFICRTIPIGGAKQPVVDFTFAMSDLPVPGAENYIGDGMADNIKTGRNAGRDRAYAMLHQAAGLPSSANTPSAILTALVQGGFVATDAANPFPDDKAPRMFGFWGPYSQKFWNREQVTLMSKTAFDQQVLSIKANGGIVPEFRKETVKKAGGGASGGTKTDAQEAEV